MTGVALGHLLGVVVLREPSCRALGEFLELGHPVVVAAKVGCECCFGVWADRPSLVDAVIAPYLLLVPLQHLLGVKHLECILQQVDLPLVISRCIGSHRG